MSSPVGSVGSMISSALGDHAFLATVSSVVGTLVFVVRPGQTAPDRLGYQTLVDPTTLVPGDRVSVLQHGASYVILGKLSVATAAPPVVAPPPTATGCYLGVHLYPSPEVSGNLLSLGTYELLTGRHAALVGIDRDFSQAIPSGTLSQLGSHGAVPFLTWLPTGVPLADITAGTWDTYLAAQAAILHAYGKPVFVRLMPDFNTTAVSWAGDAAAYIDAWRHIHDAVTAVASNTVWAWCPSVWGGSDPTVVDPTPFYPGDDFVDWAGLDGYNSESRYGTWQTFTEVFGFSYGQIVSSFTKPIVLGEWGCDDDDRKAAWFTSALSVELPSFFPRVGAFLYTDIDQRATLGLGTDWPVDSRSAALTAWADGVSNGFYLESVG